MKIESITCNQCGGPLKVPDSANFVTCNHCDAQLAIRREESITFTEQLQDISERTGTLETELRQLTISNQLIAHDQWWEKNRKKYLVSTKERGMQEPMEGRGIFGAIGVLFLGIVLSMMLLNSAFGSKPNGLVIVTIAVITCLIACVVYSMMSDTYKDFRNAHRNYLRKRSSIAAGNDLPDSLKNV